jgi:solute carrier family 35 protein F5
MWATNTWTRHVIGVGMLMIVVVLWVSSSVITQRIFLNESFDAPFFLTYFNTAVFITYLIPKLVSKALQKRQHASDYAQVDADVQSHTDRQLTWKEVFRHSIVFCPIWFTMNYLFNLSLDKTSVASNTIMSSTSSLFTLAFSACLLKTRVTWFNGLGALSA